MYAGKNKNANQIFGHSNTKCAQTYPKLPDGAADAGSGILDEAE